MVPFSSPMFFFSCAGDLRVLHSFPTRRSSDLADASAARSSSTGRSRDSAVSTSAFRMVSGVRSEEHTSELQSRLHLVCRLLLEKKKTREQVHNHHLLLEYSLHAQSLRRDRPVA